MNQKRHKGYFVDKPLLLAIGKKLKTHRSAQGISIEKFANEWDIDPSQVSRMELGKVNYSISMYCKIAKALGVDAKELLP